MIFNSLPKIITGLLLSVVFFLSGNAYAENSYKVKSGDTLTSIARKTGVSIAMIKEMNHLKDSRLQINQNLLIQSKKEEQKANADFSPKKKKEYYSVCKGDTLAGISSKTGVSVEELLAINNLSSNTLKIGQKLLLFVNQGKTAETANPEQIALAPDQKGIAKSVAPPEQISGAGDIPTEKETAAIDREKKKLLGKWNTPNEPELLVKVALAFLDAPYRLGGSSVRGIDCSGFVKKIYSLFDINLPRTAAEQAHVGVEVAKGNLLEGDLIFFQTKNRIGHVGIYIGENKFVHAASSNKGVRVDSLDSTYYKQHYKRAVRLKTREDAT
jgi:cell wall-associated NlpC family hydrolase